MIVELRFSYLDPKVGHFWNASFWPLVRNAQNARSGRMSSNDRSKDRAFSRGEMRTPEVYEAILCCWLAGWQPS